MFIYVNILVILPIHLVCIKKGRPV